MFTRSSHHDYLLSLVGLPPQLWDFIPDLSVAGAGRDLANGRRW